MSSYPRGFNPEVLPPQGIQKVDREGAPTAKYVHWLEKEILRLRGEIEYERGEYEEMINSL